MNRQNDGRVARKYNYCDFGIRIDILLVVSYPQSFLHGFPASGDPNHLLLVDDCEKKLSRDYMLCCGLSYLGGQ